LPELKQWGILPDITAQNGHRVRATLWGIADESTA